MLRLGEVQCPRLDRERLFTLVMRDPQAVPLHFFDMGGPHVYEGHILAGPHHVRPCIATDRSDPDDRDPLTHPWSPGSISSDLSAVRRHGTIAQRSCSRRANAA